MVSLFCLALIAAAQAKPIDFLAPQSLPAGCRLELVTVQERVQELQVEKVVCETEFRPVCTVRVEKDCKNVTRPACVELERMECTASTASQCQLETRVGAEGEAEQVEVCRDIPIEDCQLVKEESCREGEEEQVEECEEHEAEDCQILPQENCHQVTVEQPRLQDRQLQQIVCDQENEVESETTTGKKVADVEEEQDVFDIYDAINTIFGGDSAGEPEVEEASGVSLLDILGAAAEEEVTTTEAVMTTTEAEATTVTPTTLASTTSTTELSTTTTTEAATTTTTEATTTSTAALTTTTTTSIAPSTTSTTEIVREETTPTTAGPPSASAPAADNSKIHFRDDHVVRDFAKRIFVDDGLVDARRKALEARRRAEGAASRIFFPEEKEAAGSIPS